MAKILPPYIEGTLPAAVKSKTNNEILITVPFTMNPAVSLSDFSEFAL
jgi:hypothetical protein